MSETGRKIATAAQAVENSLAASMKDLNSGLGSFFSGEKADTHEPHAAQLAQDSLQMTPEELLAMQSAAAQQSAGQAKESQPSTWAEDDNGQGR